MRSIYLISGHVNIAAYIVQQQAHMSVEQQSTCMAAAASLCQASQTGTPHLAAHGCGRWHRAPRQRLAPQSPLHHWMHFARVGRGPSETGGPRSLQQFGPPGHHPAAKLADSGPRLCPRPAEGDNRVWSASSLNKFCTLCEVALQVRCISACLAGWSPPKPLMCIRVNAFLTQWLMRLAGISGSGIGSAPSEAFTPTQPLLHIKR